jgi:hypothetical protein
MTTEGKPAEAGGTAPVKIAPAPFAGAAGGGGAAAPSATTAESGPSDAAQPAAMIVRQTVARIRIRVDIASPRGVQWLDERASLAVSRQETWRTAMRHERQAFRRIKCCGEST